MLSDNILALIAASVIKKGYNGNGLHYNGNGYSINTLLKNGHSNVVEIVKNNQKTFMFCQEGTQNENDIITDLEAANSDAKKKVKNFRGKITKSMWNEFNKYNYLFESFCNEYHDKGNLVFAGHSLGGAVAGIAAGIYDVKSILLAPVPFMAHKNWRNNYSTIPKTYVNPTDPCCGDNGLFGQINWKAGNHIGKNWIFNGNGMNSHKISSFVEYYENKTNLSIL